MSKRVITFDIGKKIRSLVLTDTIPEICNELKLNYSTVRKFCKRNNIKIISIKKDGETNSTNSSTYSYLKFKTVKELISLANDKKLFMGLMRQIATIKNDYYEQKAFNILVEKSQKLSKQNTLTNHLETTD